MGALRPPNPQTAERGGADFGLCHDALRLLYVVVKKRGANSYGTRQKFAARRSALGGLGVKPP